MAQLAHATGAIDSASSLMQRAATNDPDNAKTQYTYGALLLAQGLLDEAAEPLEQALTLDPSLAEAAVALGNLFRTKGRLVDASYYYERALAVQPALSEVETNLGAVRLSQGDQQAAIAHHEKAIALKPDFDLAQHNLLLSLHYAEGLDARDVFNAHSQWGAKVESAIAPLPLQARADDPERPLRLGFVSPDFNNHPVSQFFLPYLLGRKNPDTSVTLYSASPKRDQVTRALVENSDCFKQVEHTSDSELAGIIAEDRIDILVDLAGHTAGTRIRAFAYQPAPLQMTWIGYPDTTGLNRVSYRLTDAIADPPGNADKLATETLYRLPSGFLCYRPPEEAPAIIAKPARDRPLTFASFNNLSKVTETAIDTWANLLKGIPGSRLLIKAKTLNDDAVLAGLVSKFGKSGVSPDRIEVRSHTVGMEAHYAAYNEVDIALDTFPYNGTTTTCDALWMGVPVICLAGDRHSARVSASLLTRLGLENWIANTPDSYVEIASRAASNRPQLAELQQGLRSRMRSSSLVDAPHFADEVESAFRAMWREACSH